MGSMDKQNKLSELNAKINVQNPARSRLLSLFDEGSFVELDAFLQTGENEAGVIAGYGLIEGGIVYAFSQDVTSDHGAVSEAHAKKVKKVYELAAKTGCPVVCIYDSHGARLNEGNKMLSAYSKMLEWSNNLSGVVPQIAVVLGTCAGISAVLATSADFIIMSKKAELFMTPPFTAKAHGDKSKGIGSAENAAKAGVASIVCENDDDAIFNTRKLLTMLPQNNIADTPRFEFSENTDTFDSNGSSKLIVKGIADLNSVMELDADYGDSIYTFFATMAGVTTAFVATNQNNPLDADACAKAARFVKVCDAFNIPVITLLNSPGFEITGDVKIVKEAAKLASAYAEATTAKIGIISGKAFGPAYIALGSKNSNSDIMIAWPQAQISALPPETAVEFLWSDKLKGVSDVKAERKSLLKEYIDTEASPFEAAKGGFVEAVISPEETRKYIINLLDMLAGKREVSLPKKHVTI